VRRTGMKCGTKVWNVPIQEGRSTMSASYPGQPSYEETAESVSPIPSLLHPLARRRARQRKLVRQERKQRLAWRVQDVLAGCGLMQTDYSIAGGRVVHIPQVMSVATGPPVRLTIRILPGQMPQDFTAKAPVLAYHLGVTQVRIIPLQPPFIRLDLLAGGEQANEAASREVVYR
jgi:hypothetical protein